VGSWRAESRHRESGIASSPPQAKGSAWRLAATAQSDKGAFSSGQRATIGATHAKPGIGGTAGDYWTTGLLEDR